MRSRLHETARGLCLAAALALALPAWGQPMGLPSMGSVASAQLSPAVEQVLGEAIMEQGRHDPTYVSDLQINQYLTDMGRRLAAHAPQPLSQTITVFAVRDPSVNAFTLPGGYIGVNSGLVVTTQSASELASVVGHEIGHVMQRHIARGIAQQSQGTGVMVASLVGALLAALAGQGQLAMGVAAFGQAAVIDRQLGFSRSAEQEADRAGFQMMRGAGFDPRGMLSMFQRLTNAARLNEGAGGDYASTHPLSIDRLSDIENRLADLPPVRARPDPEFWFVRAQLAMLQARDGDGRRSLAEALRSDARDQQGARRAAALYGLARLALGADNATEAAALLQQARALQDAPQAAMLDVRLAARQSAAAALQASAQAVQRWPDSQGVAAVRAAAQQAAGQDAQAIGFLQACVKRWPDVPEFRKSLADSLERAGHRLEAHEALAAYYEETGALPTAMEHLQQARKLSSDFYAQSRLDAQIRALRDRLTTQRALLAPFKKSSDE